MWEFLENTTTMIHYDSTVIVLVLMYQASFLFAKIKIIGSFQI